MREKKFSSDRLFQWWNFFLCTTCSDITLSSVSCRCVEISEHHKVKRNQNEVTAGQVLRVKHVACQWQTMICFSFKYTNAWKVWSPKVWATVAFFSLHINFAWKMKSWKSWTKVLFNGTILWVNIKCSDSSFTDLFDVDFYHYSHLLHAIQSSWLDILMHNIRLDPKTLTQAGVAVSITLEIV